VVSQFGLMFFEDRAAALREMWRVLRPGGRLAVAVWDSVEASPGYAAMKDLLQRLFGEQAAESLRAPFGMGDLAMLSALFAGAGIPGAQIATHPGAARFPSLTAWMFTEIKGWTLAGMIDDAQYGLLLDEAGRSLQQFVTPEGTVAFPISAHIVTA
jgi:hypothetical protein